MELGPTGPDSPSVRAQEAVGAEGKGGSDGMGGDPCSSDSGGNPQVTGTGTSAPVSRGELPITNGNLYNHIECQNPPFWSCFLRRALSIDSRVLFFYDSLRVMIVFNNFLTFLFPRDFLPARDDTPRASLTKYCI